jgi:hypothetical protein
LLTTYELPPKGKSLGFAPVAMMKVSALDGFFTHLESAGIDEFCCSLNIGYTVAAKAAHRVFRDLRSEVCSFPGVSAAS